jgi:RNA polymerase sigma factor (sigma-70 family)
MEEAPRELAAHLFRREAGKMTAVLARVLGLHNLDLAEELVQETLCQALEAWRFGALPENPGAWLMRAAKNRAIDLIRRERTRRKFAELVQTEWTLSGTVRQAFFESEIADEQLRMMFSCCAPELSEAASAALVLKLLCGFSTEEIAAAFLTTVDAVEKQIARGKATLAKTGLVEVAGDAVNERLEKVERALYLLFNEGYHGAHPELPVRGELCGEALRLVELLAAHPAGDGPRVHALAALMCLHGARLPARIDEHGDLVLLEDQNREKWDARLMVRGFQHLARSARGTELSQLHIEAAISAKHAEARTFAQTDWRAILHLYDLLPPGPIVGLNRAIVLAQLEGPQAGLAALDQVPDRDRLAEYPFYYLTVAELQRRAGRIEAATKNLQTARSVARSPAEQRLIARKLEELDL